MLFATHSSVSSSPCECISQSPPSFLSLDTCNPLSRVYGSLCTVRLLWKWVLEWKVWHRRSPVAFRLQDLHLLDSRASTLILEELTGLTTSKKGSRWWTVSYWWRAWWGSLSLWTAVIWFKLLKRRETGWEREAALKEECFKEEYCKEKNILRWILYQISPFGIKAKYCGLIGDDVFHCEWTFQCQILHFFVISWFQRGLCDASQASVSLPVSDFPTCWKILSDWDGFVLFF